MQRCPVQHMLNQATQKKKRHCSLVSCPVTSSCWTSVVEHRDPAGRSRGGARPRQHRARRGEADREPSDRRPADPRPASTPQAVWSMNGWAACSAGNSRMAGGHVPRRHSRHDHQPGRHRPPPRSVRSGMRQRPPARSRPGGRTARAHGPRRRSPAAGRWSARKPARADIIVAGTLVCLGVMRRLDFAVAAVSDGGLREGILLDLLRHHAELPTCTRRPRGRCAKSTIWNGTNSATSPPGQEVSGSRERASGGLGGTWNGERAPKRSRSPAPGEHPRSLSEWLEARSRRRSALPFARNTCLAVDLKTQRARPRPPPPWDQPVVGGPGVAGVGAGWGGSGQEVGPRASPCRARPEIDSPQNHAVGAQEVTGAVLAQGPAAWPPCGVAHRTGPKFLTGCKCSVKEDDRRARRSGEVRGTYTDCMDARKVLVLNQTYEPLQVCTARRAVRLLFTGKAERVEDGGGFFRSPSVVFVLPSIIRLQHLARLPCSPDRLLQQEEYPQAGRLHLSVLWRNGGERMTIDHIVPKSQGGRTVWENVVSMLDVQPEEGEQVRPRGGDAAAAPADAAPVGLAARHPGPHVFPVRRWWSTCRPLL